MTMESKAITHLGDTCYGRLESLLWVSRIGNKVSYGFQNNTTLNVEFHDAQRAPDVKAATAKHAEILKAMGWTEKNRRASR